MESIESVSTAFNEGSMEKFFDVGRIGPRSLFRDTPQKYSSDAFWLGRKNATQRVRGFVDIRTAHIHMRNRTKHMLPHGIQ